MYSLLKFQNIQTIPSMRGEEESVRRSDFCCYIIIYNVEKQFTPLPAGEGMGKGLFTYR